MTDTIYTTEELIDELIHAHAMTFGKFTLASGKQSDYYINIKKACVNPDLLYNISKMICQFLPTPIVDIDVIAGIELGGVPLVIAVSLELKMPMIIVRKEMKEYGIDKMFIGNVVNRRIAIIEDVTTTGGSSIEAINKIREAGGMVNIVISVVDREEGARENLRCAGVELYSLITASDLKGRV